MERPVISMQAYNDANEEIEQRLNNMGFQLSGRSNETKNEVSVTGASFSKLSGYGTAMKNNYWQYQNFEYLDSEGRMINYSVKYQPKEDRNGVRYLENLEVTNCNASRNYYTICSETGIVQSTLNNITPDKKITVPNQTTIGVGATFGALGVSAIALCIILLLL